MAALNVLSPRHPPTPSFPFLNINNSFCNGVSNCKFRFLSYSNRFTLHSRPLAMHFSKSGKISFYFFLFFLSLFNFHVIPLTLLVTECEFVNSIIDNAVLFWFGFFFFSFAFGRNRAHLDVNQSCAIHNFLGLFFP